MLTILAKLLKALNSEQSPNQLAIAVSLAAILGLTPFLSLHNAVVLMFALWFRVNLSILLISYPLFAFIGYLLSPVFENVGLSILQSPSMLEMWESFFNTVIGRWSNFYYSGVMGSLAVSIIAAIILFPLTRIAVEAYREKWLVKIEQFKVTKMLKASKFWHLYSE
ncbi:MAG: TIGR03546 family protein [Kangiellaceae bacterium]|nr:TIGR03546 family protein [Kangiellaceae bacterium]